MSETCHSKSSPRAASTAPLHRAPLATRRSRASSDGSAPAASPAKLSSGTSQASEGGACSSMSHLPFPREHTSAYEKSPPSSPCSCPSRTILASSASTLRRDSSRSAATSAGETAEGSTTRPARSSVDSSADGPPPPAATVRSARPRGKRSIGSLGQRDTRRTSMLRTRPAAPPSAATAIAARSRSRSAAARAAGGSASGLASRQLTSSAAPSRTSAAPPP
mmetsp:Transcript_22135/g.70723  ORF Transcript_22135/g.70723 Transcript_22135/m.70723 type:complete len:221 (+) Transcript_22135:129-791(+)